MTTTFDLGPIVGDAASVKDMSGTTEYGIYTAETTKRHRFGSRAITWDGRVFKYAKAGGTLNADLGCMSYVAQHVAFGTVAATAAAGASRIKIDVAATDGAAADGVVAKDALEGGYIVIFSDTVTTLNRGILANDAVASGGGEMFLTLDAPIHVAITVDASYPECMASPYSDVRAITSGLRAVIGVPAVEATSGYHTWIQTWGPCWIAPQGEVGDAAHDLQVVFRHDGSIDEHDYSDSNVAKQQHAGFVLSHATAGTQGAPFIMLQISI